MKYICVGNGPEAYLLYVRLMDPQSYQTRKVIQITLLPFRSAGIHQTVKLIDGGARGSRQRSPHIARLSIRLAGTPCTLVKDLEPRSLNINERKSLGTKRNAMSLMQTEVTARMSG